MEFRSHPPLVPKCKGFMLLSFLLTGFPYLDQLHYPALRHSLILQLILEEYLENYPVVSQNNPPLNSEETFLSKFRTWVSYFNVTKFDCTHEVIYFDQDKSYHTFFQVLHITHKFQYQMSGLRIFHHQYLISAFQILFTHPLISNYLKLISLNHLFASA